MAMCCFSPPYITTFISQPSSQFRRIAIFNKRDLELHNHNTTSVISSNPKNKIFAIGNGASAAETAVVEIQKLQFQVSNGYPYPFGATVQEDGVNFAIYSLNALSATLCLFTLSDFKNVNSSFHYSIQFQISQNFFQF
jgi:isoamylase